MAGTYETFKYILQTKDGRLFLPGELVRVVFEQRLFNGDCVRLCQVGTINSTSLREIRYDDDIVLCLRLDYEIATNDDILKEQINIEVNKIIQIDTLNKDIKTRVEENKRC